MQDSAEEGEGVYYELEVYKEPWVDHYVILLQLNLCGHHVVRIMCDGNVIGPKFFSVIYLAGIANHKSNIFFGDLYMHIMYKCS